MWACMLLLAALSAQASDVNEFQGKGTMIVRTQGPGQEETKLEQNCQVTVGVQNLSDQFILHEPTYKCEVAPPWIDENYEFKVKEGKLFDSDGVERGTVDNDGRVEFTYSEMIFKTVVEKVLNKSCEETARIVRTVSLEKIHRYILTPTSDQTWMMERSVYDEDLVTRRTNDDCEGAHIVEKQKTSSILSSQIKSL